MDKTMLGIARLMDGAPVEGILALLSVISSEMIERGEPIGCIIQVALAAREIKTEDELHVIAHGWDKDTKTTEQFDQLVTHTLDSHPPRPDNLSSN